MPTPQPPRPRRLFLPAYCRRCRGAALMAVRSIDHNKNPRTWEVDCPNCGTWRPGYPLSRPRDVKG